MDNADNNVCEMGPGMDFFLLSFKLKVVEALMAKQSFKPVL